MSKFSKAVLPLLLVFTAACGTDLQRARAQDLGEALRAPAPAVREGTGVSDETAAKAETTFVRGGVLPQRVTRAVSPADPLRLMVIGDSLADGFGMFLKSRVAERGLPVTVLNRGRTSTGLARADFYDWPGQFVGMAAADRPDIVVANFGANDNQPIRLASGKSVPYDTPEWDAAYSAQMRHILDTAAGAGAVFYLLGPAPDADSHRNALLSKANGLFRDLARQTGAHFLSLPAITGGPNGEWVQSAGGTTIRSGDGSHFTGAGYTLVVNEILAAIERDNPGLFSPSSVEIASLQ
ncbi:MAG: DUF459 domain-containing protein [Maritimibacter sp.]|nr:DUF459 domain-containing protein [Maritimibacter sp.]